MSNIKPRDVEALLKKYQNLITSVYNEQKGRFDHKSDRNVPQGESPKGNLSYTREQRALIKPKNTQDELMSYIVYQFILLVKEYDPHSGVDFPGYIKTKLYLRTRHSYIKKLFAHEDKEQVDDMESDTYHFPSHTENTAYEHLDYLLGNNLTEGIANTFLERAILATWLSGTTNMGATYQQVKELTGCDEDSFKSSVRLLKGRLYQRANKLNMIKE